MARADSLASAVSAITDPTRRRILQLLKRTGCCSIGKQVGMCACDIEQHVGLSQPTVSHHMAVLIRAGLVKAVKNGQWMWYRRNEEGLRRVLISLREEL